MWLNCNTTHTHHTPMSMGILIPTAALETYVKFIQNFHTRTHNGVGCRRGVTLLLVEEVAAQKFFV